MARTVRNAKIDTPGGRIKLATHREPHWTVIGTGAALGHREGIKGGFWIARDATGHTPPHMMCYM